MSPGTGSSRSEGPSPETWAQSVSPDVPLPPGFEDVWVDGDQWLTHKAPGAARWLVRSGEWKFYFVPSERAPRACVVLSLNVRGASELDEHVLSILGAHLGRSERQVIDASVVAHALRRTLGPLPPGAPEAWLAEYFKRANYCGLSVGFHGREWRLEDASVPMPSMEEQERVDCEARDVKYCRILLTAMALLEDEVYCVGLKMATREGLMRLEGMRLDLHDMQTRLRERDAPPTRGPVWQAYKAAVDSLVIAQPKYLKPLLHLIKKIPDAPEPSPLLDRAAGLLDELRGVVSRRQQLLLWGTS